MLEILSISLEGMQYLYRTVVTTSRRLPRHCLDTSLQISHDQVQHGVGPGLKLAILDGKGELSIDASRQ